MLRKHWLYGKYLLRHKWYVFLACRKAGLVWRGIVHDLSKFTRAEWIPYVEYFYGEFAGKRQKPWYVQEAFDRAWLLHQNRNPHHWQFWILTKDNGSVLCLPMPETYIQEMICDWRGASRALHGGKDDTRAWYATNRWSMQLHDSTRERVDLYIRTGFAE